MALLYLESSALVKRYVQETGTAWIRNLTLPSSLNTLFIAHITAVEIVAAIALRERRGNLSAAEAATAIAEFRQDYIQEYVLLPITASVIDDAMNLAERHGLRGYDAVQLAVAMNLHTEAVANDLSGITLVSADLALNAVAAAEGLTLDDPNAYP